MKIYQIKKIEKMRLMTKISALFALVAAVTVTSCKKDEGTLQGVEINPSELQLEIDDEETLKYVCTPSSYKPASVKWESSDENIVYVSASGEVFAMADGEAVITVTVDGLSAICNVTVGTSGDGDGDGEETLPLSVQNSADSGHAGETITLTANQNVDFELLPSVSESSEQVLTAIKKLDSKTCEVTLGYIIKNGVNQDDEVIIKATTSDGQEQMITLTSYYWKPELYVYSDGEAIKDVNGTYSTDESYSLADENVFWSIGEDVAVVVKYGETLYGIEKQGFTITPKVSETWSESPVTSYPPVVKLIRAEEGFEDYTVQVTMGVLTQEVTPASGPGL